MGHIQRHHLSEARCVVPPPATLASLSPHFESLLQRRILLDLESRSLRELRDELLPRLLSGEIDVSAVEDEGGRE
jgi:type I restriction enzyme S subunit